MTTTPALLRHSASARLLFSKPSPVKMPSVSLSKFTGKADVTAKDNDVVKAKLGKISYGAQGTLEASLPEGLVGKISFTDATINSVKDKPTSLQPAGVNIEIAKPGTAQVIYDVAAQKAKVVVQRGVEVSSRKIDLKATWTQKDNAVLLEGTNKPSKDLKVTLKYNTGSQVATATGVYTIDSKTSVEPTVDSKQAWNVVLTHKPQKADALKVSYNSKQEANLEYSHTEGIAKLTLTAPIKSGATVSAKLTLEKDWDL